VLNRMQLLLVQLNNFERCTLPFAVRAIGFCGETNSMRSSLIFAYSGNIWFASWMVGRIRAMACALWSGVSTGSFISSKAQGAVAESPLEELLGYRDEWRYAVGWTSGGTFYRCWRPACHRYGREIATSQDLRDEEKRHRQSCILAGAGQL